MLLRPWILGLAVIPAMLFLMRWLRYPARNSQVRISTFHCLPNSGSKGAGPFRIILLLRLLACLVLVGICARDSALKQTDSKVDGSSTLIIALDVSSSMTADDFAPRNRLEEAKAFLTEFIESQNQVEIGMIQFASNPKLLIPATLEHKSLTDALEKVRPAGYGEDGTALGSALASAVNRLRHGPWQKRRILLLTDGVNNKGSISPLDAARLAQSFQVTIDAIGIGTDLPSRFWTPLAAGAPNQLEARIQIDDNTLETLTRITGGTYQRVRSSEELRKALLCLKQAPNGVEKKPPGNQILNWEQIAALVALVALCLEFLFSNYLFFELPG